MRNRRNNGSSNLLLVGILSIVAFALVIVLLLKMTVFSNSGDDNPVSAMTTEKDEDKDADSEAEKAGVTGTLAENNDPEVLKDTFSEGITINGVDVSGKTVAEVKEVLAANTLDKPETPVKVSFSVGEENVEGDAGILSFGTDLDEVISDAYSYSKGESAGTNGSSFSTSLSVSDESVEQLVHSALDKYEQEPVEAYASGFDTETCTFIIEESQNGVKVDFEKAADAVREAFAKGEYDVTVPVEISVVEPETSAEFLRNYLCKVSSTTSTTTSESNRNINISLVCQKINGLVLQPGEQFDFNKFIGQRTAEAGFKEAGGIFNGALRQELGGGICQANAMIFHCAVKADLQIDTRSPHTWPSSYVEIGTDATVSWGGPEFRFTNTSDYPIAFHAYYANQKVTVEFYGRPLPDGMTIKLKGEEISRTPAKVEYTADPTMEVGKTVTERSSHDAIKAKAYKIYYDADGNEIKREESFYSSYPMITKKVRVGTLAPDGTTIFKLNKETGETTPPKGYVEPTPTPDPNEQQEPEPTKKPKKPKKDETGEGGESGETGNGEGSGETGEPEKPEVTPEPENTPVPEVPAEDDDNEPVAAG